jgi:hypothetical protein
MGILLTHIIPVWSLVIGLREGHLLLLERLSGPRLEGLGCLQRPFFGSAFEVVPNRAVLEGNEVVLLMVGRYRNPLLRTSIVTSCDE